MMVIRSTLSDSLALWSSHCQVNNHGDDSADPYYQKLLFSVARGTSGLGNSCTLRRRTAAEGGGPRTVLHVGVPGAELKRRTCMARLVYLRSRLHLA